MKYTIEFEVDEETGAEDLCELLCTAILEGNSDALYLLGNEVLDINLPGEKLSGEEERENDFDVEELHFDSEDEGEFSDLDESTGGPLGPGESDFEKAAEIDAETDDVCPTCGTPYEEWELIDGLWTCPGCGYAVSSDEF